MKNKIINLIENLLKEHEMDNYWTDYDTAYTDDHFYDVGRYETLTNLLNDVKNMGV